MNYFSVDDYKKNKSEIVELIKATHKWENNEGFIADGVINPFLYKDEILKILIILGESYGYNKCKAVDIEQQPKNDCMGLKAPKVQSPRKIASLLWMLHEDIKRMEVLSPNDIPRLFKINKENTNLLLASLEKVAWINVKKASRDVGDNNNTKQSYSDIYQNSIKNTQIIRMQIESIKPNLIIAVSDPVFDSLVDSKILGCEILNKKNIIQENEKKQKILFTSHPSYYKDWGYAGVYNKYLLIRNALKGSVFV